MSEYFDLSGKTALVTGSGRNIGRAIAIELAGAGADIIVNVRSNEAEAREVADRVEEQGVKCLIVLGDAGDPQTIAEIDRRARGELGGVDIYVSNAARRFHKDFFDTTDEDWFYFLNQQLTGSWYLAKTFAPQMRDKGWGRIIHINGSDGWSGGWNRVPHSTAKGGLRTLTKSLAAGLGRYGITVNDVSPGFVGTTRDPATHPQMDAALTAKFLSEVPIGRQATPEEVAWACLFLCSSRSGAMTGGAIHVDGGRKML